MCFRSSIFLSWVLWQENIQNFFPRSPLDLLLQEGEYIHVRYSFMKRSSEDIKVFHAEKNFRSLKIKILEGLLSTKVESLVFFVDRLVIIMNLNLSNWIYRHQTRYILKTGNNYDPEFRVESTPTSLKFVQADEGLLLRGPLVSKDF